MAVVTTSQRVWVLRALSERLSLRLPVVALLVWLSLMVALTAVIAVSLTLGSYDLGLGDVWAVLTGTETARQKVVVVWEFRFPRALVSALVGALLALSGATLQNVTRNGLADPSLVGISQGAGLAVVALTIVWPDQIGTLRPWVALAGSLTVAAIIQALSWNRRGGSSIRFILMGIGLAAFISASTSVLMTYGQIDRAMSALAWLSGSINAANWSDVRTLTAWTLVLIPALMVFSRAMAAQRMGEDAAVGLGVPVKHLRYVLISLAVAMAAIATAIVGPLAFVGLIAPHAARRLARSGVGMHLMVSAALGAVLVALADLLGRVLFAPVQIPAGLVTAIIGVPFFIFLLYHAQGRSTF